ncbi:hypothetical protein BRC88_01680 [Halobacteriales archaeon QS_4_69_225]|nr:MAG: hypothetical protein BRC88_01680 [Halobacteriales archaeon QS_4_69_225]
MTVVENTIFRNGRGIYVRMPLSFSSETVPLHDFHLDHLDNNRYGGSNGDRSPVANVADNHWTAADGPSSPRTVTLKERLRRPRPPRRPRTVRSAGCAAFS